jgi:heme exporter protein D
MQHFFAMGGYGTYVWSSYLLAAVIVGWNIASARGARREARARALRNLAMQSTGAAGRRPS